MVLDPGIHRANTPIGQVIAAIAIYSERPRAQKRHIQSALDLPLL